MSGHEEFCKKMMEHGAELEYQGHKSLNRATPNIQLTSVPSDVLMDRKRNEIISPYSPGKIKTPDDNFHFNIVVNPDLEDAEAMVSPMYKLDVGSSDIITVIPGSIGLIQFKSKDNFRSGIMAHEAVHCATIYMRLFEKDNLKLSTDNIDDNEERLAWLTGWFMARITNYYYDVIACNEFTTISIDEDTNTPTYDAMMNNIFSRIENLENRGIQKIDMNNLKIGKSITLASRIYEIRWVDKCYDNGLQVTGKSQPHERWIELGMDLPWDEIFHTFWHEVEHLINHVIGLRNGPPISVDDEQLLEAKEHYQVQALKQVIAWQFE